MQEKSKVLTYALPKPKETEAWLRGL